MVVVLVLGVHGCQGPQPAGALAGDGGGDHGVLLAAGGQGLVAGVQAAVAGIGPFRDRYGGQGPVPVWPWRAGRRGRGARRPRSAGAGRGCCRSS
mgnify:CR=1 FL=1